MLTQLKQYLTGPDQHLNNSYRIVILRQSLGWVGNIIEINKTRKLEEKQDSKIGYSMNGS